MRRSWITLFQPVRRRAGVTASVMRTNRSVQSPVCSVISLIGFAPKLSVTVCHANTARGIRLAIKTPSLRSRCRHTSCITTLSILEILLQVHPGIEVGHLVSIAIKQQGLALREFPKAAFPRLAPAWVWHVWIHVGIEAVLAGGRGHPGGHGLFFHKTDFDNGFDAFEGDYSIFTGFWYGARGAFVV